jgi:hypothetical protein
VIVTVPCNEQVPLVVSLLVPGSDVESVRSPVDVDPVLAEVEVPSLEVVTPVVLWPVSLPPVVGTEVVAPPVPPVPPPVPVVLSPLSPPVDGSPSPVVTEPVDPPLPVALEST